MTFLHINCSCCVYVCSATTDSLQPHGLKPTRLHCSWDFPGKDTGMGCHFLLQGIFLTQGSNPCLFHLLHWQVDSLPPVPPKKPQASCNDGYCCGLWGRIVGKVLLSLKISDLKKKRKVQDCLHLPNKTKWVIRKN